MKKVIAILFASAIIFGGGAWASDILAEQLPTGQKVEPSVAEQLPTGYSYPNYPSTEG